jgi:RNA polymerase sigma-70 factor (ECF subfamily)
MQVVRRSESRRVLNALDGLRPADREVLRLRAWEGLSATQIAAVLGLSPHAAEKRLTRAMKRLKSAYAKTSDKRLPIRPHQARKGGDT